MRQHRRSVVFFDPIARFLERADNTSSFFLSLTCSCTHASICVFVALWCVDAPPGVDSRAEVRGRVRFELELIDFSGSFPLWHLS